MKNLTIKKIALGLVLAGYAASGAFAALTATTGSAIKGRAPLVNAPSIATPSNTVNSVDIGITREGVALPTSGAESKWATGDVIELKWALVDDDGDTEGPTFDTGKTIKFGYLKGTTWTYVSPTSVTAGSAKWTIPNAAANATDIGFVIRPTTEFGDPVNNNWAKGRINVGAPLGNGGDGATSTPDPTNTEGPGGTYTSSSGPVIVIGGYSTHIFESTISGGAVTYVTEVTGSSTVNPTIGKTYAVKVMDTTVTPNTEATSTLTSFTWELDGTAFGITTDAAALTSVAGTTITGVAHKLDVNSVYTTAANGYKAGAQGFKLKVTAN